AVAACLGRTGLAPGRGASVRGSVGCGASSTLRLNSPPLACRTGLRKPPPDRAVASFGVGRNLANRAWRPFGAPGAPALAVFIGMLPAVTGGGYLCSTQYC